MPQGALQSVQHVTPSIIRPSIRTRKTCPETQKQKPRTDRRVTYVLRTDELNKKKITVYKNCDDKNADVDCRCKT